MQLNINWHTVVFTIYYQNHYTRITFLNLKSPIYLSINRLNIIRSIIAFKLLIRTENNFTDKILDQQKFNICYIIFVYRSFIFLKRFCWFFFIFTTFTRLCSDAILNNVNETMLDELENIVHL